MTTYYQDDTVTLLLGDAAEESATLAPGSVQTVVTSPPYYGLRDYGVDGQLGAEDMPAEFVANLVAVFEAIRPALTDDGTLWVNLGDSYASGATNNGGYSDKSTLSGFTNPDTKGRRANEATVQRKIAQDRPAKNMLGIPWRFAFAMQNAGWILRNDIIWAKPNAMPESVTDRFSTKHEHLFLFTKSLHYYFDLDAVREQHITEDRQILPRDYAQVPGTWAAGSGGNHRASGPEGVGRNDAGKNPGDVWVVTTKPFAGAHFATFPPELPERCILAGSREGDTVLDPFSGSATTGMVATKHGRYYIGIDLNADYHKLALKTRLAQGVLA